MKTATAAGGSAHFFARVLLSAFLIMFQVGIIQAGSATWNLNPTNGDWNNPRNWTPPTVPNGDFDVATFDVSNTTRIAITNQFSTTIGGMVFNAGASPFTFTANYPALVYVEGPITNQSGVLQQFIFGAFNSIDFNAFSTAGKLTSYTGLGGSTAGEYGAFISFFASASAEGATIVAEGSTVTGALISLISFNDTATAAQSTLIARGGAANAGGSIRFFQSSTGDQARVEVFGNGDLEIGIHFAPGVTVGSIEGNGRILLGSNSLTVGTNNRSTRFAGLILDTGALIKIGQGQLSLTGANSYTGGTIIGNGRLLVDNDVGSGTGTGKVQVNGGALGGTGIISGGVTVGTGSGLGAILSPGKSGANPGLLTINSALTFNSDATCHINVNSNTSSAGGVAATGVTVSNGALFSLTDVGSSSLASGTVLTVISNTAATPIGGTFSNLADGGTVTAGSNTYRASYEGGDGNDLTLTVVP